MQAGRRILWRDVRHQPAPPRVTRPARVTACTVLTAKGRCTSDHAGVQRGGNRTKRCPWTLRTLSLCGFGGRARSREPDLGKPPPLMVSERIAEQAPRGAVWDADEHFRETAAGLSARFTPPCRGVGCNALMDRGGKAARSTAEKGAVIAILPPNSALQTQTGAPRLMGRSGPHLRG